MTTPHDPAELDAFDLELLHLGAIDAPARRAAVEEAARGPLRTVDEELRTFERYWKQHRPPLPLPSPPQRHWGRATWMALAAAVVAAVLGATLWTPDDPSVRAMGGLPVDVVQVRDGQMIDGESLKAGDQLRMALTVPADGFLDIATVESTGSVSALVAGQPVRKGERFTLAGAIQLDDTEAREWLVVELVDHRRDEGAWTAGVRALLPDPTTAVSGRRWVREVTRTP